METEMDVKQKVDSDYLRKPFAADKGEARELSEGEQRRQRFESLISRFGINSIMMSIPSIAKALGLTPATLYGYIRSGKFFLPHRAVNGTLMVATDDFLNWCCSRDLETPAYAVDGFGGGLGGSKLATTKPANQKIRREYVRVETDRKIAREAVDQAAASMVAKAMSRIHSGDPAARPISQCK